MHNNASIYDVYFANFNWLEAAGSLSICRNSQCTPVDQLVVRVLGIFYLSDMLH